MSYLVFARKWRPLNFEDVVGQEHITSTLKRAIEKDRVAHSYIFTGTRGVGKTTTARILARALNCDTGPTPNPCGVCESCKSIIGGSSFDVLEIDGASNNGVDNIRELRDNVGYTSMGGKYRIFVIDEVHMLTKGAFNALLKTLEEPPKNVIFIFATTEPQKIPDTIHSRCQRYDFRRISSEHIVYQLEKICTQEKITFDNTSLPLIANRADGSMRDALSLLDQVYSFCLDGINEKEVRSVLGLVENETYKTIFTAISQNSPLPVLQVVNDVLCHGFDFSEFLIGFQDYIRKLLFVKIPYTKPSPRSDENNNNTNHHDCEETELSIGDLLRISEIVRKTENALKWSSFPRFLVETTLLKLVYMDRSLSVETLIQSFKKNTRREVKESSDDSSLPTSIKKKNELSETNKDLRKEKKDTHSNDTIISIPQPIESDEFSSSLKTSDPEEIMEKWPIFVNAIIKEKSNLGTFLSISTPVTATGDSIDIRFEKKFGFQFSEVNKKNNRNFIQAKLSSFFGRNIDLHISIEKELQQCTNTNDSTGNRNYHNHPSLAEDMIHEPIIKNVLEIFNGEIL